MRKTDSIKESVRQRYKVVVDEARSNVARLYSTYATDYSRQKRMEITQQLRKTEEQPANQSLLERIELDVLKRRAEANKLLFEQAHCRRGPQPHAQVHFRAKEQQPAWTIELNEEWSKAQHQANILKKMLRDRVAQVDILKNRCKILQNEVQQQRPWVELYNLKKIQLHLFDDKTYKLGGQANRALLGQIVERARLEQHKQREKQLLIAAQKGRMDRELKRERECEARQMVEYSMKLDSVERSLAQLQVQLDKKKDSLMEVGIVSSEKLVQLLQHYEQSEIVSAKATKELTQRKAELETLITEVRREVEARLEREGESENSFAFREEEQRMERAMKQGRSELRQLQTQTRSLMGLKEKVALLTTKLRVRLRQPAIEGESLERSLQHYGELISNLRKGK